MALLPLSCRAATWDVIIRNGRLIDGTGNPAYHADVAVKNGRIAAIGRVTGDANTEIDARGQVVSPGFVDVHTHAEDVMEIPEAESFLRMGVTTVIAGNCGSSERDIAAFFRGVEQTNVSLNVATLIGHGTVRRQAMGGSFDRPPSESEMAEMKRLVEQAMKDGALGLSTGLIYLPGTFAKTDEIVELAKVVARYDGIYTSHMRSEGREIFEALNEVFRVAREARCRAQVSHIKLSGRAAWGQAARVIAAIEQARAEGLDITQDQYVYTAASTSLGQLIPDKWLEGGKFRDHLKTPADKAILVEEMEVRVRQRGFSNYAYAVIADYKHDRSFNGLNVVEASRKLRGSDTLADQIETVLEIESHGGASGVFHGISEDDLREFLRHPNTMFASDSGVRRFQQGVPHPRGYGNNARVLARYVRELKLLRLEEAVRRMSSYPAATFRLRDRGLLREGAWADIAVFDSEKVQDTSQFNDPHHYATGFLAVLVNGVIVVRNDQHTGARPGMALRQLSGN